MKAAQTHFTRRLRQRYGIWVPQQQIEAWVKLASTGKLPKIWDQSNTRRYYAIEHDGDVILAVYHREAKMFVTALPKESHYYPAAVQAVASTKGNAVLPETTTTKGNDNEPS